MKRLLLILLLGVGGCATPLPTHAKIAQEKYNLCIDQLLRGMHKSEIITCNCTMDFPGPLRCHPTLPFWK